MSSGKKDMNNKLFGKSNVSVMITVDDDDVRAKKLCVLFNRDAAREGRVSAERCGSYFRLRTHRLATPSPVCLSSFRIL